MAVSGTAQAGIQQADLPPGRGPAPWRVAVAALLGLILLAGLGGASCRRGRERGAPPVSAALTLPRHEPVPAAERDRYAGSAACTPCHAKEASQLDTNHARTLAAVDPTREGERFRRGGERHDRALGIRYRTRFAGGRCFLEARVQGGTRDDAELQRLAAEYAFGSGNRGVTYVGYHRGRALELRLSYYRNREGWEFSPSQPVGTSITSPLGRTLEPDVEAVCFNCHSTVMVREAGRIRPEQSILGIGCEACHGPGGDHIAAVKRGDHNLGMARLSGQRERVSVELCGRCHQAAGQDGRREPRIASQLPRLQSVALSLSACSPGSAGRLSCITCHDPHRDADRSTNTEYNAACRGCHTAGSTAPHPAGTPCKVEPEGDCVPCHMPAQPVLDIPTRPVYRTHWIKVWNEESEG